jgi:hypothetical protein
VASESRSPHAREAPRQPDDRTRLGDRRRLDLFGPNHVLLTVHFLEEIENIQGPQQTARFVFQADQMKATGAMFAQAADLSASMKNPPGSA